MRKFYLYSWKKIKLPPEADKNEKKFGATEEDIIFRDLFQAFFVGLASSNYLGPHFYLKMKNQKTKDLKTYSTK